MNFKIEPGEVLSYLNRIGYHDISTEQLEDFIKDLKKLIKYDMKRYKCSDTQTTGMYSSVSDVVSCNAEPSCFSGGSPERSQEVMCLKKETDCPTSESESYCQKVKLGICHDSSSDTHDFTEQRHFTRRRSDSCSERNVSHRKRFDSHREKHDSHRKRTESHWTWPNLAIEKHDSTKGKAQRVDRPTLCVRSSFIRPWQLVASATSVPRRSDPVSLYHKYQTIWKLQKIPGDDSRDRLRWNVREKMMGVDPQPRPISRRATSVDRSPKQKNGIL